MSLFDKIRGLFGAGAASSSNLPLMMVVDGTACLMSNRPGRPGPRDMLILISRLSRFASKEKARVTVVFEGEALHKAGDGDELNGVTVYYANSAVERGERLLKIARELRKIHRVVVVSSDVALEKKVRDLGMDALRATTFEKAVESGDEDFRSSRGDDRGDRGDRGGGEGGGRRRPRRRGGPRGGGPRGPGGPRQDRGGGEGGGERPEQGGDAKVRQFLDVVE